MRKAMRKLDITIKRKMHRNIHSLGEICIEKLNARTRLLNNCIVENKIYPVVRFTTKSYLMSRGLKARTYRNTLCYIRVLGLNFTVIRNFARGIFTSHFRYSKFYRFPVFLANASPLKGRVQPVGTSDEIKTRF